MALSVDGFDWDVGNRDKCQAHGVSIAEIESMFLSPLSVFPDPLHSWEEQRFKAIGRNTDGRYIFLVYTLRQREERIYIRPIGARYMHRKEIEHYEKEASRSSQ
jgi:uncharacterized DUF497 family protein